ncbi:MAG: ATP-dependent dethiobiotin synthetase BioD 1 [Cyanobacteriota bacterium]|jgi:dethiobiotin synthetase
MLLIAGTDTDAGKTLVTSALAAYWVNHFDANTLSILKPLQTGMGDREHYRRLFQLNQTIEELNPIHLEAPLAPPLAADLAGRRIDLAPAWQTFEVLRQRSQWLLVEALGGMGSPITHELMVADLARDWRLPTVLVVPVKLGAIGQAVANVALARQFGVNLRGIILTCPQPCSAVQIEQWADRALIESFTRLPIFGLIPYLDDPTNIAALSQAAAQLDLDALLPLPARVPA